MSLLKLGSGDKCEGDVLPPSTVPYPSFARAELTSVKVGWWEYFFIYKFEQMFYNEIIERDRLVI